MKYRADVPVVAPEKVSFFTKAARRDLGQDDLNDLLLVRPGQALTRTLVRADENLIDGSVRGIAWLVQYISYSLKKIQNGYVRTYALIMALGAVALIATIWVISL